MKSKPIIWMASILVPLLVAILLMLPQHNQLGTWVYQLPHLIALINSITTLVLIGAFVAIKIKNILWHKMLNITALVLGVLFLVCYITYHANVPTTSYGGRGWMRPTYYFFLLTHILLSIGVTPLVLLAFYYAFNQKIAQHRRVVKYTLPIWLYVSISGVIVYLMIRPYYTYLN